MDFADFDKVEKEINAAIDKAAQDDFLYLDEMKKKILKIVKEYGEQCEEDGAFFMANPL